MSIVWDVLLDFSMVVLRLILCPHVQPGEYRPIALAAFASPAQSNSFNTNGNHEPKIRVDFPESWIFDNILK